MSKHIEEFGEKLDILLTKMKDIFRANDGKAIKTSKIVRKLKKEPKLDKNFIRDVISSLIWEGTLYEPKENYIRFTSKESWVKLYLKKRDIAEEIIKIFNGRIFYLPEEVITIGIGIMYLLY